MADRLVLFESTDLEHWKRVREHILQAFPEDMVRWDVASSAVAVFQPHLELRETIGVLDAYGEGLVTGGLVRAWTHPGGKRRAIFRVLSLVTLVGWVLGVWLAPWAALGALAVGLIVLGILGAQDVRQRRASIARWRGFAGVHFFEQNRFSLAQAVAHFRFWPELLLARDHFVVHDSVRPELMWRAGSQAWIALFVKLLGRMHGVLLRLVTRVLPRLYPARRRPVRPVGGVLRIMHTTCSFDLGGTQRQIKNLVERQFQADIRHDATEIFWEQNYLFRTDPDRLAVRRDVARDWVEHCIQDINLRSSQLIQVLKLARDFKRERPDVVIGWGHELCLITYLAACLAGVPRVHFCIRTFARAFQPSPATLDWYRLGHRIMAPRVASVIVNSSALVEDYKDWLGLPSDFPIHVVPNGIDLPPEMYEGAMQRERIRTACGVPRDAVVIGNIGRLSFEKGQETLLRAMAKVQPSDRIQPHLLLVGDGLERPRVEALVQELKLDNVHFAGRQTDIAAFLGAMDVFVMPSDFEGMSNALMEAMAAGVPVVSTNVGGATDIVVDASLGEMVPPRDPDRLALAIQRLVVDPQVRRAVGDAGRRRIRDHFTVERMIDRFNAVLVSDSRPPSGR